MSCLGDVCYQPSAPWKEKGGGLVFPRLMIERARDVIKTAKVQVRMDLKWKFKELERGSETHEYNWN